MLIDKADAAYPGKFTFSMNNDKASGLPHGLVHSTRRQLTTGEKVFWTKDVHSLLQFARKHPELGIRRLQSAQQLAPGKTLQCFEPLLDANGGSIDIVFVHKGVHYDGQMKTHGTNVFIECNQRVFSSPSKWATSITGLSNSGWDNCRVSQEGLQQSEWPTFNQWWKAHASPTDRKPPTRRRWKQSDLRKLKEARRA